MTDVEEIIYYLKSLKKGFDKDLFQSKIDELVHVVDSSRLEYEDFNILFKIWLNLTIPITKWVSLGVCLVPRDRVEERTVDYAFRWLLSNCENHGNYSRMAFLLDWLTAAMDNNSIDMEALDSGYEIFHILLSYEVLTAHTIKLIYTLTKPSDVTRRRVLKLLDQAKEREGKMNMLRQIQVLLGLFKSYKPECVPEDVPAISIHTSFKKINVTMLERFRRSQEHRNSSSNEKQHLLWINPLNSMGAKNKKADPLVPNMEFANIGSKQYTDSKSQKNYFDFSDPVSLLQYSLQHPMSRPARLRALLCNETGITLLCLASEAEQAFLSRDLCHLLTSCFLEASPHSYVEKQDLLRCLALLQRTLSQAVPAVTQFLAQYLPLWNEKDYCAEILELVEWIDVDSPEQVSYILDPLAQIFHRAQPLEQCAILRSLTNMYTNLAYASTKTRQHFLSSRPSQSNYAVMLRRVAYTINDMCNKELQVNPEDMRLLFSATRAAQALPLADARRGAAPAAAPAAAPRALALALPLLAPSALLAAQCAALLLQYRTTMSKVKKADRDQAYADQRKTLEAFTCDLVNCLYDEVALDKRKSGLVFANLHPQLVSKLSDIVPDAGAKFSLRNNLAFAPYTYLTLDAVHQSDATNKLYFQTAIAQNFPNLYQFMIKAVPELS